MNIKRTLGVVITLASIYFIGIVLVEQWNEIRRLLEFKSLLLFIALATPLSSLTAVTNSVAWTYAYRATGALLPLQAGVRIHLVSQAGKYFPGNVGHFVGRLALLKLENRSVIKGSISIVLETLWMIAAASILTVYALLNGSLGTMEKQYDVSGMFSVLVLLLALVAPNLMIILFNQLPSGMQRRLGFSGKIRQPSERVVLACFTLYIFNFLLNGLILIAGFLWLVGGEVNDPLLIVSLYAVIWLLGFVVPGAPGGLGVREALFVLLLGSIFGVGVAAALALVMRIVSVLGDLMAFGLGLFISHRQTQSSPV